MLPFIPPPDFEEFLDSTVEHHRCVQRAIASFANEELGSRAAPQGTYRAEGGVKIRGADVKIRKSYVSAPAGCEAEERAVVAAIVKVIELWAANGKRIPERYCDRGWVMGEPLSYLYSPRPVEHLAGFPDS